MRPTRADIALIWAASGRSREVVRLAARAAFLGHEVDVQLEKTGAGYVITVTEVAGERVISEIVLHVIVREVREAARLGLLVLVCEQILLDHDRWQRRHEVALRAVNADLRRRGLGDPALG